MYVLMSEFMSEHFEVFYDFTGIKNAISSEAYINY